MIRRCKECNGSGQVKIFYSSGKETSRQTCKSCDGKGRVLTNKKNKYVRLCDTCNGLGKLENPEMIRYKMLEAIMAQPVIDIDESIKKQLLSYEGLLSEKPKSKAQITCKKCNGNGAIPTEEGKEIIDFLVSIKSTNILNWIDQQYSSEEE